MSMLETARLILRQWKTEDLAPFAMLNADPEVMRFFPATLIKEESDKLAARCREGITERGYGFMASQKKPLSINRLQLHDIRRDWY